MFPAIAHLSGDFFEIRIGRFKDAPHFRVICASTVKQRLVFQETVLDAEQAHELGRLLKTAAAMLRFLESGGTVHEWWQTDELLRAVAQSN